ncbi:MAG: CapA family protein [Candidatus Helarchaeota archaeon]|nr:CapA family protein [Candidatus Helarchaeota archaeon]
MGSQDKLIRVGDSDWAKEIPRKKLSTPYNLTEKLSWLKNNLVGPSKKFKNLTSFIPQKSTLNEITPKCRLGFLGDIMKMNNKDLQIDPAIKSFFQDVDFLVGNFEGTISKAKKVFMVQEHTEGILSSLETLFPPSKFALSCANNHSGDFGWSEFNKSYQILKNHGFIVFGRRDEPSILLNDSVNITNCTAWSNQPNTPYVGYLDQATAFFNPKVECNILYPHWGYEMQLYPNPKQIELGKDLLKQWALIVGHHSHVPQPITSYEMNHSNQLLAYGLGDFSTGLGLKKYQNGIVVKLDLGSSKTGQWEVGTVEWKFTRVHEIDKNHMEVKLEDECDYFKKRT